MAAPTVLPQGMANILPVKRAEERYSKPVPVRDHTRIGPDMSFEIERKYLVTDDGWRGRSEGVRYRQGYLCTSPDATARVRVGGGTAFVTLKGKPVSTQRALARPEFEYPIPLDDAEEIIDTLCGGRVVEKTRYRIPHGGVVWEVDEFHGQHAGLVLAEIELEHEDQTFAKPAWLGEEVTQDYRYANSWLAQAGTT